MAIPTPMIRPSNESKGPSPLHGHDPGLVCKVALSYMPKEDFISLKYFHILSSSKMILPPFENKSYVLENPWA